MMDANIQTSHCPGCGLTFPKQQISPRHSYNAATECYEKYSELTAYTLSHRADDFIHQHVVDAYAAQHSGSGMKNISTLFALIGLYYAVEHGYNGRQVQRVHMLIARLKYPWDTLSLPQRSYSVTVMDVLHEPPGDKRDGAIREWMIDVWGCWSHQHEWVRSVCHGLLG
ncbi:DUF5946 family protein [Alicyclobacillus acidoterrestris]|uniref:DUF5946 family protein n=1 Tax=Alicyclobacillus acidoterrestris (strain ATCC 49025 / DSM 3922 / CIP 106132 / NCIMB 13137 / GD3B) TaxID=1356854 RepID=T0BVN7_ALIAG|nr:DUF5946 family protein [Alicyclobacillus acidoterrestris]EPZ44480.1 hypothetical protein N007_10980 [Alicyclobacillus acidoterrestris ATCC 49025]UNO49348.1 DUF5946 family protein [Alicyclobacillus acidoterrestris]